MSQSASPNNPWEDTPVDDLEAEALENILEDEFSGVQIFRRSPGGYTLRAWLLPTAIAASPTDYREHRAADLNPAMDTVRNLLNNSRSVTIWKEGREYVVRGWKRSLAFVGPAPDDA